MGYDPYRRLAALILADGWGTDQVQEVIQKALKGRKTRSAQIAKMLQDVWTWTYTPSEATLARILRSRFTIRRRDIRLTATPPVDAPFFDGLPDLGTPAELAAWLEVSEGQLAWLADVDGRLARRTDRQGHYVQTWIPKRKGGHRLLEAPLPRLKALQKQILSGLLDLIPPHPHSFGFVKGRDCRTAAARHAGEDVVICVDLADFFPSVPARRVHAIFRTIGYSPSIARLLTGLVTTRTPSDLAAAMPFSERGTFTHPHLPQGAPTSPALANLAAWRLDQRMAALARRLGANYSRYADDLTISGDRGLAFESTRPVLEMIQEIAFDEGFRLNPEKTRIQKRGTRQKVTGIVVNQHLNVPRDVYDRLKATLTNCVRHGPSGQNRTGHLDFRAHLDGRIGWVEALNPRRGLKLRAIFDQIEWS
ncbi:MAG: reverse transcriptase family protein [Pseudomonadota bacterium]